MIAEHANHLSQKGHHVNIVTSIFDSVFTFIPPVNSLRFKNKMATIVKALFWKSESDIVIADIIMMSFLLSFRNRAKVVYFAQDYDEEYYQSSFMKLLIRFTYILCLKHLKIPVIAVAPHLADIFRNRFRGNVALVPNGVDTSVFHEDRNDRYIDLKKNKQVVLIFARSDYRKGFDVACTVLKSLRKEIERNILEVWCVGEQLFLPFPIGILDLLRLQSFVKFFHAQRSCFILPDMKGFRFSSWRQWHADVRLLALKPLQ